MNFLHRFYSFTNFVTKLTLHCFSPIYRRFGSAARVVYHDMNLQIAVNPPNCNDLVVVPGNITPPSQMTISLGAVTLETQPLPIVAD